MQPSLQIVVARYQEDITWLQPILHHCIIYNKGSELVPVDNVVPMANRGRESDTYLRYILERYDDLPDVVVFTQADISDHNPTRRDPVSYLLHLASEAFQYGKSQNAWVHHERNGKRCWSRRWNVEPAGTFYLQDNYKDNQPRPFDEWFIEHIQPTYPDPIHIYRFGIFAMRKEVIRRRPVAFYQSLLQQVNHHSDPAEGHFMERSWYYL